MKTYYINEVRLPYEINGCKSDRYHQYVGLFTSNTWVGEGTICRWYGNEFYTDTKLLAFFQYTDSVISPYNPKNKLSNVYICDLNFSKIQIGSHMWEATIKAKDDEAAIKKFENLKFK